MARKTWKEYCAKIDGVIFMVDASDDYRYEEAKEELIKLFEMPEI